MARRRKVNRDNYRADLRKQGVCPKCREHVGRGLTMHERHCAGVH